MKSPETYNAFCEAQGLPPSPETARLFIADQFAKDEIKRHYDEVFLASLNPDGGNLAGFHGVGEEE